MVGTISGSGRSLAETHSTPCLCLNPSRNSGSTNFRSNRELGLWRTFKGRKQLNLSSSFLEAWCEWRLSAKMVSLALNGGSRKRQKIRKLTVVGGLEVEDDDSGEDVKNEIINVITYKAVRTVLQQLYEMNPPQYTWFYKVLQEKRELAERVMITRLSLYSIWMQKCDHAELYNRISDENVELMRERLAQTVIWPSDDDQIAGSLD
uniref:Uncharacterized protein n=1 Tax=Solanum lycopersicum TaxID=4081 RepID=A0A3Q7EIW3_SOLLC